VKVLGNERARLIFQELSKKNSNFRLIMKNSHWLVMTVYGLYKPDAMLFLVMNLPVFSEDKWGLKRSRASIQI